MKSKTKICLALCFLLCFSKTYGELSTEMPETNSTAEDIDSNNCEWQTKESMLPGISEESVKCVTNIIDETFGLRAFGVHHPEHVSALNITCNFKLKMKSLITENMFAHLTRLRELVIEYCKILFWPPGTLANLSNLRNLTIKTRNVEWSNTIFELSRNSFKSVRYLEWLDLSMNNIYMFPDKIFCPILNLMYLNISYNHLNDIRVLKFSDAPYVDHFGNTRIQAFYNISQLTAAPASECSYNLRMLDLSGNQIPVMPSKGISVLKNLEELYISRNNMNIVSEDALFGLDNLQVLDMSQNRIVQLPANLFTPCLETIRAIQFNHNSISALSTGLFRNLAHLISLDLSHNQLSEVWLHNNTFCGLIRLVMFNLSHNRINTLDPTLFIDMYSLQVLSLDHNFIDVLAPNIFKFLSNLHTLHLSHNRLTRIDAHSLNGLFVMNWLDLSHNDLEGFHPQALRNCSGLQDFIVSHNKLKYVPEVLRGMHALKNVDLEMNLIEDIRPTDFEGMTNLHGLTLSRNKLNVIGAKYFPSLPSLKILKLGDNNISKIEDDAFSRLPNVEVLSIEDNFLTTVFDLFIEMSTLNYLNISNNKIQHFDYYMTPPCLLWLDLSRNMITEIGNMYELNSELQLKTFYLSHNNLTILRYNNVPLSLELLFLNNNQIDVVDPYTFKNKTNLKTVDLRGNLIPHLDLISILISEMKERKQVPKFFLGNNPFQCDCGMEWLQRAHVIHKSGFYPEIADLESISCNMIYENKLMTYETIFVADSSKFLCEYEEHCFSLCRCCDYGACDCRMSCPYNCTCYNDQTWKTNIVDCSNVNYKSVPASVPMDATTVYLDGNNIRELKSHTFIARMYLTVLYLNHSNIEIIRNSTFTGMKSVMIVHLEYNKLTTLVGHEFTGLGNVNELHLEENRIRSIHNATFAILNNLTLLFLHGNQLHDYDVWNLDINPRLLGVTLSDNQWSCDCNYMILFYKWYKNSTSKVVDADRLGCSTDIQTKTLGPLFKDINSTNLECSAFTGYISFYASITSNTSMLILAISAVSIILMPLVIFCIIRCRKANTGTGYFTCFRYCCSKEDAFEPIDLDQPCVAYIAYSTKDEPFIRQILLPGLYLDNGPYNLRIHYRDFNPSIMGTPEFIENCMEKSEKVVMVLSWDFLCGEWSELEYKEAFKTSLMRHRKPLFIVLLGFVTERELEPDIGAYYRSNFSMYYVDPAFWDRLKYDFLIPKRTTHMPFLIQSRTHPQSCGNPRSSDSRPYEFSHSDNMEGSSSENPENHYSSPELPRCVHPTEPSVWE